MDWIGISIVAYFILAIESVANKFLISGKVKSWRLYLFYIGLLSLFSFVLAPLGLAWPGWTIFTVAVISGIIFFCYLTTLFLSLKRWGASRVFVLVGATSTLATLFLSRIFLGEELAAYDIWGISFLIIGSFFISFKYYKGRFFSGWRTVVLSGFFFAASLVMLKYAFDAFSGHNFISVYIYSRVGIVGMTIFLLIFASYRNRVFELLKKRNNKKNARHFGATVLVKAMAGVAAIMINYSIAIGSVTIVNALSSVQYLFVFILSIILSFYFKKIFQENLERKNTLYKAIGAVLVVTGIIMVMI